MPFLLLVLLLAATPLSAQQRAFTPADWYRLTTVSSPAMSPDGERIAFTVTTVNEAENKRHSEVWLVASEDGEPMRLTSPGTESSAPRWSQDGDYLFFTSRREGGEGSTWALRMDGTGGEAFQLEGYPEGSMPRDANFVVYSNDPEDDEKEESDSTSTDPFSKMEPMARPPWEAITEPVDPKRFDGRHITDMRYKANGQGFVPSPREARAIRASQLWIQAADGSPKKLIDTTRYSRRSPAVSPDGQWIAYVADPDMRPDSVVQMKADSIAVLPYDAKRDESPRNDGDIFLVAVTGGTPRRLTSQVGAEGDLAFSPDGKSITFTSSASSVASSRLYMVPVSGGTPVN
ncbi:MAG: hypothetical protein ACREKM_03870, partial [Longimicrobiales bacterium]